MEHKKICNTCGKVFCYTDEDVNGSNLARISTVINALGGLTASSAYSSNESLKRSHMSSENIVDYNRCPYCHSKDVEEITGEELEKINYQKSLNNSTSTISIAPGASEESIEQRIELFIEDNDFSKAYGYINALLDINPKNSKAYFYQLLVENKCKRINDLIDNGIDVISSKQLQRINDFNPEYGSQLINEYNTLTINKLINKAEQVISVSLDADEIKEYVEELSKYKDNAEVQKMLSKCNSKIDELLEKRKIEETERLLASAQNALKNSKNLSQIENIISELNNHEDIEQIHSLILELENKKIEINKKRRKNILMAAFSCVAIALLLFVYNSTIAPSLNYNKAIKAYENKNYNTALTLFRKNPSYKESSSFINNISKNKFSSVKIDDFIEFGEYKGEPIVWRVLDVHGSQVLLFSEYVLDNVKFDNDSNSWNNSYLKKWLNDSFYNEVFANGEKEMIITSSEIPEKVYLLNYPLYKQLFGEGYKLRAKATSYAEKNYNGSWWLGQGSPYNDNNAACIGRDGLVDREGLNVSYTLGVRPFIRVETK